MKEINFSLWCDFLESDFINLEFTELIQNGTINGATSNPSIFKNAICNSIAYNELKDKFRKKDAKKLYEILATNDIKMAATKLLSNYARGDDGFVSIEVDPNLILASDIIDEGKRLYNAIKMPNVMIKIPAISPGFEAMSELMKKGIDPNTVEDVFENYDGIGADDLASFIAEKYRLLTENGNAIVVNIAPNKNGKQEQADIDRLLEASRILGIERKITD